MGRDAVRLRRTKVRRQRHGRRADRLVPLAPCRLQMPALRRVRRDSEDLNRQAAKIQAAGSGEGGVIDHVNLSYQVQNVDARHKAEHDKKTFYSPLFAPGRTAGSSRLTYVT